MGTLTITSESFNKLFGLKQKIENDMGISLSYHTGMILGNTRFYKEGACWLTVSSKGELTIDGRLAGIIKNKCALEGEEAVVATITSAKECCKAVAVKNTGEAVEIIVFKEGRQIATARGTLDSLKVVFAENDDLWIAIVFGWCALEYVFMRAWDKITYFDPDHTQPKKAGEITK